MNITNKIKRSLSVFVMVALISTSWLSSAKTVEASTSPIRYLSGFQTYSISANDDSSTGSIPIGFTVNFFDNQHNTLYVNNNGNITFDASQSTYTPYDLTSTTREIVAAFFGDVDTRGSGSSIVTYGNDTVNGRAAFGVNYLNVGYYSYGTDKLNSFQLILIDRSDTGVGNFDIEFNYEKIQWEAGDASGGSGGLGGYSARAGFSNGTGTTGTFFELPGSAVNGAFLDTNQDSGLVYNSFNSSVPGRYVFEARNGTINTSRILHVPYYYQYQVPWCQMTALSMLLKYYGLEERNWEIATDPSLRWTISDPEGTIFNDYWGYPLAEHIVNQYPGTQVFYQSFGTSTLLGHTFSPIKEYIIQQINLGRPIWLGTSTASHAVLITGYDNNNIYLNDSSGVLLENPQYYHLADANLTWTQFESKIMALGDSWVETIVITNKSVPTSDMMPTINLGTYRYQNPVWPWQTTSYDRSGLVFRNRTEGILRMLQFQYDGAIEPYLGYKYVPTELDSSDFAMKPGNPNSYYQPNTRVQYAATLADHMYLDLEISNSKLENNSTVSLWINKLDSSGNISDPTPVLTLTEPVVLGTSTSNIHFAFKDFDFSGDQSRNAIVARFADQDHDSRVDNPSGMYLLTARVAGASGETDRFEVEFAVTDSEYAGVGLPTMPPPSNLQIGKTSLFNFQVANWGTIPDEMKLYVSHTVPDPFSVDLGIKIYLDENYDGIPDGPSIGGLGNTPLPQIQPNSFLNLLFEITPPSGTPINTDGLIKFTVSSEFDSEETAYEEFPVHFSPAITQNIFRSNGIYDGWILESTEISNAGGTMNATATSFNLGDGTGDKQYRSILSFNSAGLPDTAVITKVTLKIRAYGALVGNNNPFTWGQGLRVDVCKGTFGTSVLQLADFNVNNATNCKLLAGTFGNTPVNGWYIVNLISTARPKINLIGLTQFRLRFYKDDNDDNAADYWRFYSGNYATVSLRPTLIIEYYIP